MKAEVIWSPDVLSALPHIRPDEIDLIDHDIAYLERFPEMYPVKRRGLFRGHRWFTSGNWLVLYRYASGEVRIRAVWPARIPIPR